MSFKVIKIIDGDTIQVSPDWEWDKKSGSIVRCNGYNTPEKGKKGYEAAKQKLSDLIEGETVELKNPVAITYGRILCDVIRNGKNIKHSFPLYKT